MRPWTILRAPVQSTYKRSLTNVVNQAHNFGNSKMPVVPLTDAFPDVVSPSSIPHTSLGSDFRTTTLSNGLRIVSRDVNKAVANLGVFIDTGSRYEDDTNQGINHFLEGLAFKSTSNRSAFEFARETSKRGCQAAAMSTREHLMYSGDCLRDHLPHMLGSFGDVLANSEFKLEEVNASKDLYREFVCNEKAANPDLLEFSHAAAFKDNTLGRPLYASAEHLEMFTPEVLKAHTQKYWTSDRMVVSAVGIEHAELVDRVTQAFDGVPRSSGPIEKPEATYTGGHLMAKEPGQDGLLHFTLGFKAVGWHDDDLLVTFVLQSLMGGGGSFSAGGPGKGMLTRLYRHVLNGNPWVINSSCDAHIYNDSSLFTISGAVQPEHGSYLANVLVGETFKMAGVVTDLELSRAKNQLKSSVLMHLESSQVQQQDMGNQMFTYNEVRPAADWAARIDAVTASDVRRVAADLIRSPLTIAATGDSSALPDPLVITRAFQQ